MKRFLLRYVKAKEILRKENLKNVVTVERERNLPWGKGGRKVQAFGGKGQPL